MDGRTVEQQQEDAAKNAETSDTPIEMADDPQVETEPTAQSDAMDEQTGDGPSIAQKPAEWRNAWHRAHWEMCTVGLMSADRAERFGNWCGMVPDIKTGAERLTFNLQAGPIKEVGEHGLQVDDILRFACHMLSRLNKHPYNNIHNSRAIAKIGEALNELAERTAEREAAGTEGTSKP